MAFPLQITFRQTPASAALESRIRELAARLERFSTEIIRCHVIVQPPSHHQRQGSLYDFTLELTLPDARVTVRHTHPEDHAHEDPYVALRDAFTAARRKLQDYERKRRGDVKRHSLPTAG